MKNKKLITSILILIVTFSLRGSSFAQESSNSEKQPIKIQADHIEHVREKNIIKAWGRVVIEQEGEKITSDKALVDQDTGKSKAIGNVVIRSKDGTVLRAEEAKLNLKTNHGILYNVRGTVTGQYIITADELEKLEEKHYQADDVTLTTCEGDTPDWLFDFGWTDLLVGDRALFTNGLFKIKNIPVFYLPFGYVPVGNKRKSGFLLPSIGNSSVNGFTTKNSYFWAINDQHDVTIDVNHMTKRGVETKLEYLYAPSKTTSGQMKGVFLDDDLTSEQFWKFDAVHTQQLPYKIQMDSKLDFSSGNNYNKTFVSNTASRTRRSSDSYTSLTRNWQDNSVGVLGRFRESTEDLRDDSFGRLPQVTFKSQPQAIFGSPFYFNQDTTYTTFLLDLDKTSAKDDIETYQRTDIHPQISLPMNIAPWMSFTPKFGVRETYYSKEITATNERRGRFSRELWDVNAVLEGPKFNKVFVSTDRKGSKYKHIIEPRVSYDFIPERDRDDIRKIKRIDGIDTIAHTNRVNYSLTQRLLRKDYINEEESRISQIARFEVSQTFDIVELERGPIPGDSRRPYSPIRFDFDSRLIDPLLINADATYNHYDNTFKTFNAEVGIKPFKSLTLLWERRYTHKVSAFNIGTATLNLPKGFDFQFSSRYDERADEFVEKDYSFRYNDKCKCWGVGFDFIQRNIISRNLRTEETIFMFRFDLRGVGGVETGKPETLHRTF